MELLVAGCCRHPKAADSEGANLGDILLCPPENSIEDRVRPTLCGV